MGPVNFTVLAFSLSSVFIAIAAVSLYVRKSYREYDRKETLKEQILGERVRIKKIQDHFMRDYDPVVYRSMRTNIEFCLKLILNKSPERQLSCLSEFNHILYETDHRLSTDYDNVDYILKPMQSFRERLFSEQMEYIRDNS